MRLSASIGRTFIKQAVEGAGGDPFRFLRHNTNEAAYAAAVMRTNAL
jgi:hypothetical protein